MFSHGFGAVLRQSVQCEERSLPTPHPPTPLFGPHRGVPLYCDKGTREWVSPDPFRSWYGSDRRAWGSGEGITGDGGESEEDQGACQPKKGSFQNLVTLGTLLVQLSSRWAVGSDCAARRRGQSPRGFAKHSLVDSGYHRTSACQTFYTEGRVPARGEGGGPRILFCTRFRL